jgi:hypothetical protein
MTSEQNARFLQRAREHCIFFDVGDVSAALCRSNFPYGIAKIQFVQRELGFPDDASFISTCDCCITRNQGRWEAGFGYGGRVDWSGDFIPLELKPNCCGVLVAGLEERPDGETLRKRSQEIADSSITLDGVTLKWDFDASNHFINLYEVIEPCAVNGWRYLMMIHGSGKELRGSNALGPGLYLEDSEELRSLAGRIDTPWGPIHILDGEKARDYYRYYQFAEKFCRVRRAHYARLLCPESELLFNETHQGLHSPNSMLLGCYAYASPEEALPWYPVTFREDLPAYLLRPLEIYGAEAIDGEGLLERTQVPSLGERLAGANIMPHGGGYHLPDIFDFHLREEKDRRYYRILPQEVEYTHLHPLSFEYRGESVLDRMLSLSIAEVAAKLRPLASLRIKARAVDVV